MHRCILSKFYIKPQHSQCHFVILGRCILSKFYIKPQHFDFEKRINYVVSYRNSTSNHNKHSLHQKLNTLYLIEILHQTTTIPIHFLIGFALYLIEILHQTTTKFYANIGDILLYLIEILHQTTTRDRSLREAALLYLIEILHQTTTNARKNTTLSGCILSKFYIKPQQ